MFSALRQGNLFYILDKSDVPELKIGYVTSVSAPQNKFGQMYPNYNMESTVDITVKVDEETQEFKNIPSSLSIANFGSSNIVVSETKEAMSQEVESILRNSKLVIESIPTHEKTVISCEEMLKELNPLFAKLKNLEDLINKLETKVGSIENSLEDIKSMLSKALIK